MAKKTKVIKTNDEGKVIISFNNMAFKVNATNANINIEDSYRIISWDDMNAFITLLKKQFPDNEVLQTRTRGEIIHEWRAHNFLFAINYNSDRTKDVDIDKSSTSIFTKIGYYLISFLLYWTIS